MFFEMEYILKNDSDRPPFNGDCGEITLQWHVIWRRDRHHGGSPDVGENDWS